MHKRFIFYFLIALFASSFFVRVYKTDTLLGFYFDQGRDALKIWDFWHKGDIMLIGPTTGIAGIFRGPWYYYLIAPFYLIGRGNPVWPAVFLSFLATLAIVVLYYLGKKIEGELAGIIAAVIASFSYLLILAARWLSNPTPMLLISMLLVWFLLLVTEGKKRAWIPIALLLGLAIQFGSAAEIFYFPAVLIFAVWQRKKDNLPSAKIMLLSSFVFFVSFVPQIIFDFVHDGILSGAIRHFLLEEESFKLSFWEVAKIRLPFYWEVFSTKIWIGRQKLLASFVLIAVGIFIANFKKLWQKEAVKILVLLLLAPLVGMLFFQGNYGNVFDYYFTGFYLPFILLFSILLSRLARNWAGILVLIFFFVVFFKTNLSFLKPYFAGQTAPFTFVDQKQALAWIYQEAGDEEFNIDVYVPPVIPYAYDYLVLWQGQENLKKETVPLLFTLYEIDLNSPQRLEAWLARQEKIGEVQKEMSFNGITVQRRTRL